MMSPALRMPGLPSVPRQTVIGAGAVVLFLLAEVALGLLLPTLGATGAMLIVLLIAAPVVLLIKPGQLVVLTLLSLYFTRLLVFYGAPSILNFAHYSLAMVALLKLLQTRGEVNRGLITCLVAALMLTAVSSALGGWQAFRPFMAWLTLYEPFIFFGVIASMDVSAKLQLRKLAIGIALVQLPLAASQFAAHNFGDDVQGTLVGQGAGHHIMGAICSCSGWVLLWSAKKRSPLLAVAAFALLGVGVLADAKQIYGALIVAVMIVGVLQVRRVGTSLLVPGIVLAALMFASAQFYAPMATITDTKLGEELFGNKIGQMGDIASDMGLGRSMLGLGAGNGLSRAALVSVPPYSSTVPTFIVGSEPAALAASELAGYDQGNVSSAASPFSSWLGIFSDLGFLGLAAYIATVFFMVKQLARADESHRRTSYVLLALAGVLGYIFTWLEEPAFTVFVALLISTGIPGPAKAVEAEAPGQARAAPRTRRLLPLQRSPRRLSALAGGQRGAFPMAVAAEPPTPGSAPGGHSPLSSSLKHLLAKGFWGSADQMLLSATNFATLVFVARAVSPAQFGSYALVITFVTLVLALQAGLLNKPYSVLSASRVGDAYRSYVTSVALAQAGWAAGVTLVLLLAAVGLQVAGLSTVAALTAIAGPTIAGWALQEFIRQVLYAEGRVRGALFNDGISYGTQVLAIVVASLAGVLTPVMALAIVAGSSFLAFAVGLFQIRGSMMLRLDWPSFRSDSIENWRFGRWMAGGAAVLGGMEMTNAWAVAGFVSVAATGALRAITAVMGPTHILLRTMDITLTPIAARIVEKEGVAGLHRFTLRIFWLTTPLMLAYCVLVAVVAGPVLKVVYGPEYAGYAWLLQIVALNYLLTHLHKPASIGVSALREAAPVFHAQMAQAILVVTVGVVATYFFGLAGSAVIMVVAAVAQNLVIWRAYFAKIGEGSSSASAARNVQQGEFDASTAH